MRQTPIDGYAVFGDCRSAALVSRDGSVDWLCLPRFDGPSVFAALLDPSRGGSFSVRPAGAFQVERRYVGATNVLETTFHTPTGELRLTDFVAVAGEEAKRAELWPDFTLARHARCVAGEVALEVVCDARPDYGRATPRIVGGGAAGWRIEHGTLSFDLRSELPLHVRDGGSVLEGTERLRAGETRRLAIAFTALAPAVLPPLGESLDERLAATLAWWEGWSSRLSYEGPYREVVQRSALALKLMCFAPSGAVVAAPTTSLPEVVGGSRNWDYRYCWLRVASLTTASLLDLGYHVEAASFRAWSIPATTLTWPALQVLYTVYGDARVPERTLPELSGYLGSRPVRVGNGADGQLQLDVYGEVVDAAYHFVARGGELDSVSARRLAGIGRSICRLGREPDEGIWEARAGRRHHTLSKAMCWVALDRLLRLGEAGKVTIPTREFEAERRAIREAVESRGYDRKLGSYVAAFDSDDVDASLLLLGLHGYCDPRSPEMVGTAARIRERLGVGPLLYRNRSGQEGVSTREGCFGICSFWGVHQRALQGEPEAAAEDFRLLLGYANDVGLFAEEIDPATGAALGNFPQAFTHVGLIGAALALEPPAGKARRRARAGRPGDLKVRS
jgi:GH15 family glucan-1,4-alpha-glucosidase